jgi:PAS domain S-box-containing protein
VDADRNLLFGVLALQADLLDAEQFVRACMLWTARKETALADLLIELGWITTTDKADVERLLERKLKKHAGNARASLAAVPDDVKRSLAALGDSDVERSLTGLSGEGAPSLDATIDLRPPPGQRYALTRLHATGGIGRVWLAHDSELGRPVALKELRPEKAEDAVLRGRFLKEARITGQLEHPGVVPVYELAHRPDDQQPFYTMRYVHGRTLSDAARAYHQKRRDGRADSLEFVALLNAFVAVCNTVAYAHSRGVVHRDLKGQNVVLGDFGEVVVLDWGLAKVVGQPEGEAPAPALVLDDAGADGSGQTVQGQALGTPAYMAPEQAAGWLDRINRRTDVYGLGAILYEILTGQPPFTGPDTATILRLVQEEEPILPRQLWTEVPPALEAVCLRALAKQPEDRPAAAADLAQAVQGWQEFERRKAEEALRDSEALYHSLVESLPCMVVRKDLEGRFTFANQRYCEFVGHPLDQILGKTGFDVYPRDLAEKYRRDDQKVLETSGVFEDIEEAIGVEGRRYVHVLKTTVRDAAGKVTGIQLIAWDVTERKLAEEELRKSRERFELAVQGSQDGLWDWDLTSEEVYYSPRYKAMLGYEDDEFPNRSEEWAKRVHPEDLDRVRAELRAESEGRESLSWLEFRMLHKDGSYRWIRSRAFILRDAAGRIYRKAGSHEDITERKAAEEALLQQTSILQSILHSMADPVVVADEKGRFMLWNQAADRMIGVGLTDAPPEEWTRRYGCYLPDTVTPYPTEELPLFRAIRGETVQEVEVFLRNPEIPEGVQLSVNASPLKDAEGALRGGVAVCRDITERKHAEEALRESEERYRSVIAAMQDGIALLDPDGTIRECNAAAERILGLSAEQIMGRTPHDPRWRAIHEDGSPFPGETHPPMVTLRTGQPCSDVLMGIHKPDGTLTWITINSQPLFRADGKTLSGVVASFEDITDRRRTEEALRQALAELAEFRRQLRQGMAPPAR